MLSLPKGSPWPRTLGQQLVESPDWPIPQCAHLRFGFLQVVTSTVEDLRSHFIDFFPSSLENKNKTLPKSSMHVNSCATIRLSISRCAVSRLGHIASISSRKMIAGAADLAACPDSTHIQNLYSRLWTRRRHLERPTDRPTDKWAFLSISAYSDLENGP